MIKRLAILAGLVSLLSIAPLTAGGISYTYTVDSDDNCFNRTIQADNSSAYWPAVLAIDPGIDSGGCAVGGTEFTSYVLEGPSIKWYAFAGYIGFDTLGTLPDVIDSATVRLYVSGVDDADSHNINYGLYGVSPGTGADPIDGDDWNDIAAADNLVSSLISSDALAAAVNSYVDFTITDLTWLSADANDRVWFVFAVDAIGNNSGSEPWTWADGDDLSRVTVQSAEGANPPQLVVNENAQLDDFAYRVTVRVRNDSGTDQTLKAVPITMNSDSLVDGGFCEADGADLFATNVSGTELASMPQGMTSNDVTWWLEADSLPDGQTSEFYFNMGLDDADMDFNFLFEADAEITVADHANLDLTDDLEIAADVSRVNYPTASTGDNYGAIYNLNDCTGTTPVDIANSHDATGNTADWVGGQTYNAHCALDFERSNTDVVSITDHADFTFADTDTLTFEAWYKPEALSSARYSLGSRDDTVTNRYNWNVQAASDSKVYFGYYDTVPALHEFSTSGAELTAGAWSHIAVVYTYGTGSSAKIYIDGAEVTATWTTLNGNVAPETLGNPAVYIGNDTSNNYADGVIDEVRVWRDTRTTAEILGEQNTNMAGSNYTVLLDKWGRETGTPAGYGLALFDSGSGSPSTGIAARIDEDELTFATAVASGEFAMDFANPDLTIYIDDVQQGTTDTGQGAIATNAQNVAIGTGYDGRMEQVIIYDAGTADLQLGFAPDENEETQTGSAGNSWVWTGTIADQSANAYTANYTITRSFAAYSIYPLDLVLGDLFSEPAQGGVVRDVTGTLGLAGDDRRATESDWLLKSFFDTAESDLGGYVTSDAWWFLMVTVLAVVLAIVTWVLAPFFKEMITMLVFVGVYFMAFAVGVAELWWPLIMAIVALGVMGLNKWRMA